MEEDIKVLEKFIKDLNLSANELLKKDIDFNKITQAIENLIADNKRLDKENQALFEAYNFNDTNLLARILKEYREEILNSIPKSKVREKIEEINKEQLNYNEDYYWFEQEIQGYSIDKLQELLEERN